MKVRVKEVFIDRYSGELHEKGAVLLVDQKRFNEIQSVGDFVEEITDDSENEEKTKKRGRKRTVIENDAEKAENR